MRPPSNPGKQPAQRREGKPKSDLASAVEGLAEPLAQEAITNFARNKFQIPLSYSPTVSVTARDGAEGKIVLEITEVSLTLPGANQEEQPDEKTRAQLITAIHNHLLSDPNLSPFLDDVIVDEMSVSINGQKVREQQQPRRRTRVEVSLPPNLRDTDDSPIDPKPTQASTEPQVPKKAPSPPLPTSTDFDVDALTADTGSTENAPQTRRDMIPRERVVRVVQHLRERAVGLSNRLRELEKTAVDLEATASAERGRANAATEQVAALTQELAASSGTSKEDLARMRAQLVGAENDARVEQGRLEATINNQRSTIEEHKARITELEAEIVTERDSLQASLTSTEAGRTQASAEARAAQQALQRAEQSLKELRNQSAVLQANVRGLEQAKAELLAKLEEAGREAQALTLRAQRAEATAGTLTTVESDRALLQTELDGRNRRIRELEIQLADLAGEADRGQEAQTAHAELTQQAALYADVANKLINGALARLTTGNTQAANVLLKHATEILAAAKAGDWEAAAAKLKDMQERAREAKPATTPPSAPERDEVAPTDASPEPKAD